MALWVLAAPDQWDASLGMAGQTHLWRGMQDALGLSAR
jgi:hypothetical protein